MSAKTSRPAPTPEAPGNAPAPWNFLTDLGRQQLAVATETACAMFRGNEAMRKIQQQAAHHASVRHQTAAQKLRGACEPADLLAIESELLRFDLQDAAHYWQQLTAAALQAQIEMMTSASHIFDSEAGGSVKTALEAFQAAIPTANGFFAGKPDGLAERSHAS